MKTKIFLLTIIALCLFAACSRKTANVSKNVNEIVAENLSPEEKEKLYRSTGLSLKENKYLSDNLSRVEISYDDYGIRLEKQFYNNLPTIKYIAIHTFPNGSKQIFVYAANGNVRSFSENMMSYITSASPDELTQETLQAQNEDQLAPTSGGITIKTLPPITIQPSQTPAPAQTQPSPVPQTAEKAAETKPQPSPAETTEKPKDKNSEK